MNIFKIIITLFLFLTIGCVTVSNPVSESKTITPKQTKKQCNTKQQTIKYEWWYPEGWSTECDKSPEYGLDWKTVYQDRLYNITRIIKVSDTELSSYYIIGYKLKGKNKGYVMILAYTYDADLSTMYVFSFIKNKYIKYPFKTKKEILKAQTDILFTAEHFVTYMVNNDKVIQNSIKYKQGI